jgi:hypothetical protein
MHIYFGGHISNRRNFYDVYVDGDVLAQASSMATAAALRA